ncbi:hypothetical protein [Caenimonas koreensis]|uniref:Uncharacterized protein n=1 Tax=Caenimonas koreensis DSM 17982 TaxID=1121255 RepID=A0A844BH26_9BURK|nr:hypothetical protein [Caenimonas koreensis]MRD49741.1 hypothetical protein [Caenimonas koreensis DSM 17982]
MVYPEPTRLTSPWLIALAIALAGIASAIIGSLDAAGSTNDSAVGPAHPVAARHAPAQIQIATGHSFEDAEVSKPQAVESLSQRVDRLAQAGTPDKAFEAVQILNACIDSQLAEREGALATDPDEKAALLRYGSPKEKCASLLPGQLAQRFTLVIQAAEARVPNAYVTMEQMVDDNPYNTELAAAARRVIQLNIAAADPQTLLTQHMDAVSCAPAECTPEDLARGLTLWTAYRVVKNKTGPDEILDSLIRALGTQQAQAAIQAGEKIALDAHARK